MEEENRSPRLPAKRRLSKDEEEKGGCSIINTTAVCVCDCCFPLCTPIHTHTDPHPERASIKCSRRRRRRRERHSRPSEHTKPRKEGQLYVFRWAIGGASSPPPSSSPSPSSTTSTHLAGCVCACVGYVRTVQTGQTNTEIVPTYLNIFRRHIFRPPGPAYRWRSACFSPTPCRVSRLQTPNKPFVWLCACVCVSRERTDANSAHSGTETLG